MSTESASAKLSNAVTTFAVEVVPSAPPTSEAENGDCTSVNAVAEVLPQFVPPGWCAVHHIFSDVLLITSL